MKATIHLHLKPKWRDEFKEVVNVDLPEEVLADEDELREALIHKPVLVDGSYGTDEYTSRYFEPSILEDQVMEKHDIEIMNDFIIEKVDLKQ